MKDLLQKRGLRNSFLIGAALTALLASPLSAERLRISPDDLRLRVAVSDALPPSTRKLMKELARFESLPLRDGVLQTEELFTDRSKSFEWTERETTLARYYFLVARLEASRQFSDEFLRREKLLRKGVELLNDYLKELHPLVAQAPYNKVAPFKLQTIQELPLTKAERTEDGTLLLTRQFPNPSFKMGRQALKELRDDAQDEKDLFKERIDELKDAEKVFLQEVSTIDTALIKMRPDVRQWVTDPGEGLPFSP